MWYAVADCADGFHLERYFPYSEDGNFMAEDERQYNLESWLISECDSHGGCNFYSVSYVDVM